MSWHYLLEQEAASWAAYCWAGAPSALSSLMPMPEACCSLANETGSSTASPYGTTSAPSMASRGGGASTSLAAASHAKTSPSRDTGEASVEPGPGFGLSSLASLAKYDPDTSSWKTPQLSLFEDSTPCSVTWPRWGTMRAGECWARSTPARLTSESASGLWPTPAASAATRGWGQSLTGRARYSESTTSRIRADVATHGWAPRPHFLEWLMGWPIGWTALAPLEMAKFQRWLTSHGRR